MYKGFANQLQCIAFASICVIIGLAIANGLPLVDADEELGSFDMVKCQRLLITNEKGDEVIAYLGNANQFSNSQFIGESDTCLLAFISANEQSTFMTNSCLSIYDKGQTIQLWQST